MSRAVSPEGVEPSNSTTEPSTSSWRVSQFHHGDVSRPRRFSRLLDVWCRRRDSNPHDTQFLRLQPLPGWATSAFDGR